MAEDDQKREVKMPAAWGASKEGPKKWSTGARGDDPTVRVTHAPLADGIGTGKAFFFVFGFKRAAPRDQEMLKDELAQIDDDRDAAPRRLHGRGRSAGHEGRLRPDGGRPR